MAQQLKLFEECQGWFDSFKQKYFDELCIIDIDATLHPDTILSNLMRRVEE